MAEGGRARYVRDLHMMLQIMLRILKSFKSMLSVYVPVIHVGEMEVELTGAYIGQICRDCFLFLSF